MRHFCCDPLRSRTRESNPGPQGPMTHVKNTFLLFLCSNTPFSIFKVSERNSEPIQKMFKNLEDRGPREPGLDTTAKGTTDTNHASKVPFCSVRVGFICLPLRLQCWIHFELSRAVSCRFNLQLCFI